MPIVSRRKDVRARSLTLVAHFAAPRGAVWDLWSSPRRLERWWGPADLTMTVETFELRAGGAVRFHVVGPDGTTIGGRFDVVDVAPPERLSFDFSSDGLEPTRVDVAIEELVGGGASMTITTTFTSDAAMQHAFDIGFDAGLARAVERAEAVAASSGP
jgi:uncharacterized protein YndB with AHSA1/START domain